MEQWSQRCRIKYSDASTISFSAIWSRVKLPLTKKLVLAAAICALIKLVDVTWHTGLSRALTLLAAAGLCGGLRG
jgi:hypothetical protein